MNFFPWSDTARRTLRGSIKENSSRSGTEFPYIDTVNGLRVNIEPSGQINDPYRSLERPNFGNSSIRKFASRPPLSMMMRTMLPLIKLVFTARSPSQMGRIATYWIAARMRSLMFRGWLSPVRNSANDTMHTCCPAVDLNGAISIRTFAEWPNKAFIPNVGDSHIVEKFRQRTSCRSASKRVAQKAQSLPVAVAKPFPVVGLAAPLNRAYPAVSHIVSPHVSGQGRALLKQRFRPVLFTPRPYFEQRKSA